MQALHRRKFTDSEKRAIVVDAAKRGIHVVLREHKLSYSVFSRWRQKFQPEEAKEQVSRLRMLQQLKELATENERLKKIVASQALEIQINKETLHAKASGKNTPMEEP